MTEISWSRTGSVVLAVWASAGIVSRALVEDQPPRPQDAATAVLAAFDRYDVVGMNAAHSNEKQDEFILALVRQPVFPLKVNDIVVECGNRRYQPLPDRYIAGEDVSIV